MRKEIFLASYFGGLGDCLQFSTLPELYSKAGHDVYIWDNAHFRNKEIKELVWDRNPYVLGTKSGDWNAGDTPGRHKILNSNCISNWEMLHGFSPTNTLPKIYYEAECLPSYDDVVLVDLTSISTLYSIESLSSSINKLQKEVFKGKRLLQVRFKNDLNPHGTFNSYNLLEDSIEVSSLLNYCDLMNSCFGIIALHAGASHLSSCIKLQNPKLKSVCLVPQGQYEDNTSRSVFIFDNIQYISV